MAPPELRAIEICMRDLGLTRGYVVGLVGSPRQIRRNIRISGLAELLELLRLRPKPSSESLRAEDRKCVVAPQRFGCG